MADMVKCKTCGKELPQSQILNHYRLEHPRAKKQPGLVAGIPLAPETKPPAETPPVLMPPPVAETTPPPPETKPEAEEMKKDEVEVTTIKTAGIFSYEITLPADAFMLYNLAKAFELEKDDKSFDEWIWDCVKARYAKDYKKQLVLTPVEE